MTFFSKSPNKRSQIKKTSFENPSLIFFFLVLGISVLPFILNLLGFDFASTPKDFSLDAVPPTQIDEMFNKLTGAFSHTILEWSAFCTAIFTVILAFTHYRVSKDVTMPIIGVALFSAGALDAFHTLAATRLIDAVADNANLIPFTWAICRIFNVAIMIVGVGLLLLYPQKKLKQKSLGFILLISVAFGLAAYAIIDWCATSAVLPQTQFPGSLITRPYDVLPLVMFVLAGIFIYYPFHKRHPSIFSYALLLSVIPEVITEAHMAFGSEKLFDNDFNIAHFLKVLGYLIPFLGLCLEYVASYKKSQVFRQELSSVNQKLDLALSQAQIATKAKSNFLASMTHELRTPMNGVIGMANLLSETKLDKEQRQQVDIIKVCANSLLTVINDILDFSKIEAGKMDIECIPFNVKKMCRETIELVRFQAEGKDLKLEFECHNLVDFYVKGDPNRLRQILLNFLSNAIKFTLNGHVKLILSCPEIESQKDQGSLICLRFGVEDTGVGIPENVAEDLFTPFSQADSSTSRKFGGTGLGLTISRKLAGMMDGKIWLKSIEGQGATFYMEALLKRAEQAEVEALEKKEQGVQDTLERHGLTILLAEDNLVNQMVALSILKKIGYVADVANNGLEVLAALDKKNYDLIFMDMMMPEMDGLEATKEICKRFEKKRYDGVKRPRIIAMTANAMAEDKARCLKAGMDDFMSKPIVFSELKEKILATPQITPEPVSESKNLPEKKPEELEKPELKKTVSPFKGSCFQSQKVLESFEDDEDMIPDIIDLFLKTSLEYMVSIKGAIDSQDAAALELHSHTLKGSARTFYADRAIEISQALEDLGKNKCFDKAQMLYDDLQKELPLLQRELEDFKKKFS